MTAQTIFSRLSDQLATGKYHGMLFESAIHAALRDLQDSEWKPIESAPKDGTLVLLFQPREGHKVSVAEWGLSGWILADFDPGYDLMQREVFATHWMPLPEPPQ